MVNYFFVIILCIFFFSNKCIVFYVAYRAAVTCAASDIKHYMCYVWGLLNSVCHWLAPESLSHYWRCVITQCALDIFGTPPLYNPKCQHCPLYQPRGDVHMQLWVKTQCEEIPKAEKTTRGPFKSTLPRCCARRERALINNNTVLRSRFHRIQLFTAASMRKRWGNVYDI